MCGGSQPVRPRADDRNVTRCITVLHGTFPLPSREFLGGKANAVLPETGSDATC